MTQATPARWTDRALSAVAHLYRPGTWTVVVSPQGVVASMAYDPATINPRLQGLFASLYWVR